MKAEATAAPALVYSPHPLLAGVDRTCIYTPFLPGESVEAFLARVDLPIPGPVLLTLNDRVLDRGAWRDTYPRPGDLIHVRAQLQGGGGDRNKVFRTLLTIAVVVAAGPAAGALGFAEKTIAFGIAKAVIAIAGIQLVNALVPPPTTRIGGLNSSNDSPTYSLSGGSNRLRPYEPLPIVIGRHRIFPDLGAREYTDFSGEDQYLYQVFNFGLSDVVLSDFKIGDTPLASNSSTLDGSYTDINLQESGSNGVLTLFPSNVDTLAGTDLTSGPELLSEGKFDGVGDWTGLGFFPAADDWQLFNSAALHKTGSTVPLTHAVALTTGETYIVRATVSDRTAGSVTLALGGTNVAAVTSNGAKVWEIVAGATDLISFTPTSDFNGVIDNVSVFSAADNYVERTSSPGATALAVDVAGYLFYTGNNGLQAWSVDLEIEYREVGSGTWLPFVGSSSRVTIKNSSRKPVRLGYRKNVDAGQYDVRLRRVTAAETDDRVTSQISWLQLRTYQPDTATYIGQKRLALAGKATNQFQGTIETLSAIASARCPVWTGSAWVVQETSNPAWWYRYIAKGKFDASGRRMFGAGLPDARINDDEIKEWGAWCDAKGLTVNLIFDTPMNCDEMLTVIARCGRASPTWSSGKYGVIWDAEDLPATAVYGMGNILRNTFRVEYATGKMADEIVATFINPDLNWAQDTVRASVPGVVNPTNPVSVQLFGKTNKDEAGEEALLLAAAQKYRKRLTIWETDLDGLNSRRGDVVIVSHDLTRWGLSGRLKAGTTTEIELDRAVPFTPGEDHYLGVILPDGSYDVYDVVYQAGESSTLTLSTPLPIAPGADPDHPAHDYGWVFEPLATPGRRLKIKTVEPLAGGRRFRFTAIDETPDYYAAVNNPYSYTTPGTYGNQYPTIQSLDISDTLIKSGSSYAVRVTVAWDVAGEYGGAWIRWQADGEAYRPPVSVIGRSVEFETSDEGTLNIEISAFNRKGKIGPNSVKTELYAIVGKNAAPSDVDGLTGVFTETGLRLTWSKVPDVDIEAYEVRNGANYAAGPVLASINADAANAGFFGPGAQTVGIKARDTTKHYSKNATYFPFTVAAPAAPVVTIAVDGGEAVLAWSTPASSFPVAIFEVRYGADFATGTPVARINANTYRLRANWLGPRNFHIRAEDRAGNPGDVGSASLEVIAPTVASLTSQVIDNNVLLYLTGTPGTLPIDKFRIRRGDVFVSATVLGEIGGTFHMLMENQSGIFTYWAEAKDSAGNYGAPKSLAVKVDEPPDYTLLQDYVSDFSGTKSNALLDIDGLLMPVNTTETVQEHADAGGWTTPQQQIDAGYEFPVEPVPGSGYYEESIDYGTVLQGTRIVLEHVGVVVDGTPVVSITLSTKLNAGDAWTDFPDVSEVFATNFRYFKYRVTVTSSGGDDLYRIQPGTLRARLDIKKRYDGGSGTANSADASGTLVTFNRDFIDITALTVTPKFQSGIDGIVALYDFVDAPNPTGFYVYLFRRSNGARLSGDFSWNAEGY